MRMPGKNLAGMAAILLAAGCMYVPLGDVPRFDVARLSIGGAQVLVAPRVLAGGYRAQAVVVRYTADDIDHLVVKVYRLDGSAEVPIADPREKSKQLARVFTTAEMGKSVLIAGLAPSTTYRLRAFAYAGPGDDPALLINDTASSSVVDLEVKTEDRPTFAELPVQLIDKIFDGQGTGSVALVPGQVNNAGKEGFE